ncbi:hypothetical protein H8S95_01245 [Pontibacter sp. KCTC 32443]|uniref:hypothetical protein n=1 Tax=Pontibacter TaxID=323449 RepID=UPI00164E87A6|nr:MULTISPECIES: hypothetical protein [Pontibacter]MBC5772673.1 hypothetical protein [Pontibacter sp. KCTC 32443]
MPEQPYPLKPRYYRAIPEMLQEVDQDISEEGMRKRCMAISILQDYMLVPSNPALVPTSDGALTGIVFTVPAYAFTGDKNPIWEVYQDLLLKLPNYTILYILAHETITDSLKNWIDAQGLQERTRLHAVPDKYQMTIWAEDSFELVVEGNGKELYLVQPHSHRRTSDGNIGYRVSEAFGWKLSKVPLYFEGGNMLVGDDFILLGADHAVDTFRDWSSDQLRNHQTIGTIVADLFQKYIDKERSLYFVGSAMQLPYQAQCAFKLNGEEWTEKVFLKNGEGTVQPVFHIDMFITLAGRNSEGKYQLLVGDPRMAAGLVFQPDDILTTPDAFDEIAAILDRLGFEVVRNPLPMVYVDDPEIKLRKWYFASYNNALVEIKPEGDNTVWLPTYGHGNWQELERTDQENRLIWERLGFKVILLKDFHPFAENTGSAHCIKKYIRQ